jgi:acyl dehydratase
MLTQEDLAAKLGVPIGTSDWYVIDQERIDMFATTTEDEQFIHTDPRRAREGPFGTTIAHGFLTLSMLSALYVDAKLEIDGEVMSVNYGFNKVRFISPVASGQSSHSPM